MAQRILAACGNDCAACPRHLPKRSEELRHTAELWRKIGYRDHIVSTEEISCTGCKPENWCRYDVIQCAAEKQVPDCGKCGEYPCEKIRACFEVTESFRAACRAVCDPQEWNTMEKAFFEKKKNLDSNAAHFRA